MTAPSPEREPYQRPVISASRLVVVGGEKGSPGCERKLAGQYLFGMKQSSSTALEFGSALHAMAEELQATGVMPDPEGDVARVLASGAHMLETCGKLLVEYEHRGEFPDGSPYVAFLDGGSDEGHPQTSCVVVQDIKTTSNARYALVPEHDSEYAVRKHVQAMMYAWVLLCNVHWYAPRLPHGAQGTQQWRIWDPVEKNAKHARLRWLYFLTKGTPRAWDVSDFVTRADAQTYLDAHIMPLVAKINALHEWHYSHPHATLDEIDRNLGACGGRGRWCGVHEHNACSFDKLGTPVLDLVQLKVRKMTSPQDRLAALRNRNANPAAAVAAPAPEPPPAPVQETPKAESAPTVAASVESASVQPDVVASSTPEPVVSAETEAGNAMAAELSRGQKAAATRAANKAAAAAAATAGGINPPECAGPVEKVTAPPPAPSPVATTDTSRFNPSADALAKLTTGQVCDALIAAGYVVTLSVGRAA